MSLLGDPFVLGQSAVGDFCSVKALGLNPIPGKQSSSDRAPKETAVDSSVKTVFSW